MPGFESEPNKWFYLLQDWSCPAGAWDWREYATCTGSFATEEEALNHLFENNSNPGGYSTLDYESLKSDGELKEYAGFAADAQKPRSKNLWR